MAEGGFIEVMAGELVPFGGSRMDGARKG